MPGGTHSSQHQKSPIYRTLKSDPSGDEKELLFPFSIAPSGNPARKLIRKREREADLFCGWAATLLGVFGLGRAPPRLHHRPNNNLKNRLRPPAQKKTFIPDPSCFRAGLDLAFAAEASFPFPRRARGGVRAWCQNYASLAAPPEEEDKVKLFGLGPAPKPCMYVLHSLVLSRALISREEMKHI